MKLILILFFVSSLFSKAAISEEKWLETDKIIQAFVGNTVSMLYLDDPSKGGSVFFSESGETIFYDHRIADKPAKYHAVYDSDWIIDGNLLCFAPKDKSAGAQVHCLAISERGEGYQTWLYFESENKVAKDSIFLVYEGDVFDIRDAVNHQ